MFLHSLVGQNTKTSNANETTFFHFIGCDVTIYLCKKNVCHNVLKMKMYSWNDSNFYEIWNIY
jgi:hypothetical protein